MNKEQIIELIKQRIKSNNSDGEEMNDKNNPERADELFAIAEELQDILNTIEAQS